MSREELTEKVDCPVQGYPGHVILPYDVTPEQFDRWWRETRLMAEQEAADMSSWFIGWKQRHFLVKSWHVKGIDPEKHVTEDPLTMPSMRLVAWIAKITTKIPGEILDLPKLQAPSRGAENGSVPESEPPKPEPKPKPLVSTVGLVPKPEPTEPEGTVPYP